LLKPVIYRIWAVLLSRLVNASYFLAPSHRCVSSDLDYWSLSRSTDVPYVLYSLRTPDSDRLCPTHLFIPMILFSQTRHLRPVELCTRTEDLKKGNRHCTTCYAVLEPPSPEARSRLSGNSSTAFLYSTGTPQMLTDLKLLLDVPGSLLCCFASIFRVFQLLKTYPSMYIFGTAWIIFYSNSGSFAGQVSA
jgi:hypothetical protein